MNQLLKVLHSYGRDVHIILLMMAVMLSGTACSSMRAQMGIWSGLDKEVIIACADQTVSQGSVSHPFIVPISTSRIAVTYYPSRGMESWHGDMVVDWPAFSDDRGKTWQFGDPMNWASGMPPSITSVTAGQHVVAAQSINGGYFAAFTVLSNEHRFVVGNHFIFPNKSGEWVTTSAKSYGENLWYGPFAVKFDLTGYNEKPTFIYLPPRGIMTETGDIGMAIYVMVNYQYQTLYVTSHDGGSNFVYRSNIATIKEAPWGSAGPCEASLVMFSDGELYCLMRTVGGGYGTFGENMVEARSFDAGNTWVAKKSYLRGVQPALVLGEDDTLYCMYGRPGNQVAISRNRGRTWGSQIGVTDADFNTSGYVDGILLDDETLIVVYDRWGRSMQKIWLWEPPPPQNCIISRTVSVK